jgi:hypothetical protein
MKLGKAQRNKNKEQKNKEQRTKYKKEQRTKNKAQRTKNKEQRTTEQRNKEHIIALRAMIEKNKARSFLSFLLCYFSFLSFLFLQRKKWNLGKRLSFQEKKKSTS